MPPNQMPPGPPPPPPQPLPAGAVLPSKHHSPWPFFVLLGLLLLIAIGGFVWAFMQYRDHRDNVDEKVAAAVTEAEAAKTEELEADFEVERNRTHNKFTTNPSIANVTLEYPRDWSVYLEENTSSRTQISAIFHPTIIRKASPGTYGMRLQLVQRLYDQVLNDYRRPIDRGELTARPIRSNGASGMRLDGMITRDHNGAVVIFPIRDKTLIIRTDSREYASVFNQAIEKLNFTP